MQPERHRVVEDRVHGQSEECHEAEEDEDDLNQHDCNLTERAHGAHLRREVERRVMINQYQCDAEKYKPEPPAGRGAAGDGPGSAQCDDWAWERFIRCKAPRGRVVRDGGRVVNVAAPWRFRRKRARRAGQSCVYI